jgi:hypothetical protein
LGLRFEEPNQPISIDISAVLEKKFDYGNVPKSITNMNI